MDNIYDVPEEVHIYDEPETEHIYEEPMHIAPHCRFCRGADRRHLYRICNCEAPYNAAHIECLMIAIQERRVPRYCVECRRNFRGVVVTIKKPPCWNWFVQDPRAKWDLLAPALVIGYMCFVGLTGLLCMATNFWQIYPFVIYYLHDFAYFLLFASIFVAVIAILKIFMDMEGWRSDNATIRVEATFATADSGPNFVNQRNPSGSPNQPNLAT